jgi:putative DNA primase/helicase
MKRILVTRGVKVFIIDNIASLAGGLDENSKRDWDPVNSWLIDLRFNGITSILLHHTNKDGGQRGTSAREDNIDMSIILKHPPDYVPENGADFVLTFSKTRLPWDDLKHVQDMRFTLRQDEAGQTEWSWGFIRAKIKEDVIRLLQEGIPGKDIAEQLGVTRGRISQIKQEAGL